MNNQNYQRPQSNYSGAAYGYGNRTSSPRGFRPRIGENKMNFAKEIISIKANLELINKVLLFNMRNWETNINSKMRTEELADNVKSNLYGRLEMIGKFMHALEAKLPTKKCMKNEEDKKACCTQKPCGETGTVGAGEAQVSGSEISDGADESGDIMPDTSSFD